jgi:hypothetical protein
MGKKRILINGNVNLFILYFYFISYRKLNKLLIFNFFLHLIDNFNFWNINFES